MFQPEIMDALERAPESAPEAKALLAVWATNPYAGSTIALCNWLAGQGDAPYAGIAVDREHVVEFGGRAAALHANRPAVLIALGRMFLAWSELSAALTTLVRAATLAPTDGVTYRLLGEVLYRRGDARRAAWVLERAAAFGMNDPETRTWLEAARASRLGAKTG